MATLFAVASTVPVFAMKTTCALVRLSGHGGIFSNRVREAASRRLARWTRTAHRRLGADGLVVSTQGLKVGYVTLYYTCLDFWQAWRSAPDRAISPAEQSR